MSQRKQTEIAQKLFQAVAAAGKLETLSDEQIASLLEEHVWAHESMLSIKGELLSTAIDRLRRSRFGAITEEDLPDDNGFFYCKTHSWEQKTPCPECPKGPRGR